MAEKKKFELPREYDGNFINEDEYFTKRRESALKNSRERTSSYPRPEWCSPDNWYDCLSTATSNYGEQNVVTGNGTF